MIIDGKEVIYSVKAKKLVYPEIPTEGLVCYLDARGKTNNDKHRGTLLDLSGNGNHVTLQNFNFTEESGYVKDSSSGTSGLRFDGVDDYFKLELSNSIGDLTFMLNAKIRDKIALTDNPYYVNSDLFLIYKPSGGESISIGLMLESGSRHWQGLGTSTADSIIVSRKNDTTSVHMNGNKTDVQTTADPLKIFNVGSSRSKYNSANMNLDQIAIWNRALTDEEIQQLTA